MARQVLDVSPVGRVEGDLDVRVEIEDGQVTSAWTQAVLFRGFELILKGKDPQAGLIVTPRICGICGGSHLWCGAYALDTAWETRLPPNAILVRNIAQASETVQSAIRWFYALFAIDFANKKYAGLPMYDEVVRRFAAFRGSSYASGVRISSKPVEIYAILGGQWPHSSFMVPGGVMGAPYLTDITRCYAILQETQDWVERHWLGGSIDSYLEVKTWDDLLAWLDATPERANADLALFVRFARAAGLDRYGRGPGKFLASGTYVEPDLYPVSTISDRNRSLISRSGFYDGSSWHEFDHLKIREEVTSSWYEDYPGGRHPWEGETRPIDPEIGLEKGKYSWAKSPRYDGHAVEVGPLARQVIAGWPDAAPHQDHDPFILNVTKALGPSAMVRSLARMHEMVKLIPRIRGWLDRIDVNGKYYVKPQEKQDARGFGGTEAARGALMHWIVLKGGRIENYQVITPTAFNIGPRDGQGQPGPIEQALLETPIHDLSDPVEIGHVCRSFDSCLVCTVHVVDARSRRELVRFRLP